MPAIYYHLAELPGRGMALVAETFADGREKLAGMLLDRSVPCEDSVVDIAPTDMWGLRVSGRTGVSDTGISNAQNVGVETSGRVTQRLWGVSFPFTIPEPMVAGLQNPVAAILVGNTRLVAIGLFAKASPHRILVFRKSDRTSHRLPRSVRAHDTPRTVSPRRRRGLRDSEISWPLLKPTLGCRLPETAGRTAWRTGRSETGPSMTERFRGRRGIFPGRLHLYDMELGRSYTITTNQGDSEIILVENGVVYYRVGTSIYKASIGETGLGPPQLIAKSNMLGDAHWAFIRQP